MPSLTTGSAAPPSLPSHRSTDPVAQASGAVLESGLRSSTSWPRAGADSTIQYLAIARRVPWRHRPLVDTAAFGIPTGFSVAESSTLTNGSRSAACAWPFVYGRTERGMEAGGLDHGIDYDIRSATLPVESMSAFRRRRGRSTRSYVKCLMGDAAAFDGGSRRFATSLEDDGRTRSGRRGLACAHLAKARPCESGGIRNRRTDKLPITYRTVTRSTTSVAFVIEWAARRLLRFDRETAGAAAVVLGFLRWRPSYTPPNTASAWKHATPESMVGARYRNSRVPPR